MDVEYTSEFIPAFISETEWVEWKGLIGWVLLIACHYPAIFGGHKHRGSEWISQISIKLTKIKTEIV